MKRNNTWLCMFVVSSCALFVTLSSASDRPFSRRSYQLGATISEIAATEFPDEKAWPGTKLFFSSEDTYVWGKDSWLPIKEIRESMHRSWKDDFGFWVPIKDIRDILPYDFTESELEGDPTPYRQDKNHNIKEVKPKDLEKYADDIFYIHPPKADLPRVYNFGSWVEAGVIVGEFYKPTVDRKRRVDGKPWVSYWPSALWLGDVWNKTKLYFYQPESAEEPVLFYIETTGSSSSYDRLKALFEKTYGEPTSIYTEPVQNKLGAVFNNEAVEYQNDVSRMILYKYDSDLDTGKLVHIHSPTFEALQAKLKRRDAEAASKL